MIYNFVDPAYAFVNDERILSEFTGITISTGEDDKRTGKLPLLTLWCALPNVLSYSSLRLTSMLFTNFVLRGDRNLLRL